MLYLIIFTFCSIFQCVLPIPLTQCRFDQYWRLIVKLPFYCALLALVTLSTHCVRSPIENQGANLAEVTVNGPSKDELDYESMVLEITEEGKEPVRHQETEEFKDITFPEHTTISLRLALLDAAGTYVAMTQTGDGSLCPPETRTLKAGNNDIILKVCRQRPDGNIDVIQTADPKLTIEVEVVEEQPSESPAVDIQTDDKKTPPSPDPDI